jgi:pimeloyl-ACP methyl ester carboxylesterase
MNTDPESATRPLAPQDTRIEHGFLTVNGVRLHYVEAGQGPLVLLLHGFPEFWYSWRRQIPALAAAGYRAVALDLRGYNLSDKPKGVAAYGVRTLVEDVRALITALGATRAHIVGHDWGAGIAWAFAMRYPEMLERLAVLNGPHPERLLSAMRDPRQLLKSWYMFFFQLPWLPEYALARNDYALLFDVFDELPPWARLTPEEHAGYRAAFEQPGALHAAVNYYRAMLRPNAAPPLARIDAEVLVLWGERDPYLGSGLAVPSADWVPRARVEYTPTAGHFVQHARGSWVNERLLDFLESGVVGGPPRYNGRS